MGATDGPADSSLFVPESATPPPAVRERLRLVTREGRGPVADEGAAGARDRPAGDRGARALGARGGDRPGRRAVFDALAGRRRTALRPGQALPPRQGPGGDRHHRRACGRFWPASCRRYSSRDPQFGTGSSCPRDCRAWTRPAPGAAPRPIAGLRSSSPRRPAKPKNAAQFRAGCLTERPRAVVRCAP
jgi:hypothetical protein